MLKGCKIHWFSDITILWYRRSGIGSLYIGSSASNLRFVFYEKGYEQNWKYGKELEENWNRYELRFRQETAVSVVRKLLKYQDVAGLAMEVLNSKIRFLEYPPEGKTTRKRLYPIYKGTIFQGKERIRIDKALLNVKEFSEYLGIGDTKARELLHNPNNHFTVRIGNRLYAHKGKADKWLSNQVIE